jgi:uncharacterized peroxidase-related enzyme
MAFVDTVPDDEATGAVADLYRHDAERFGYVPNFTKAFSSRPEAYEAWLNLNGSIKRAMELRRYELATLAAARELRSSYCALAHGSVLLGQFMDADALQAVVSDHHSAGLDETDVAVMDLAEKVAADATSVTQADIDRLRALGLSDADVVDVVLAAAARSFFSKVLDALGARPDARYADKLEPRIREALTVGHPIAAG